MLKKNISQLHKELKNGSISTIDILQACRDRLNQVKELNAFITVTCDSNDQANISQDYFQKGKPRSILEGIPIAVKDNFCVKDVKTTCASKMLQNFKPKYTATVVNKLLQSGGILIGKTNMDEFAMGSGTTESIYGPTKNIWGSSVSPSGSVENSPDWFISGGSSGGSAVAVASGCCFGALGSDTGGSTRNPASYCGVVGLKPSYGLLSRFGLIPLVNSMDVPGILSKNVEDASILLRLMAGHDNKDSTTWSLNGNISYLDANFSVRGLKIGIPVEYNCEDLSEEVRSIWNRVAGLLEEGGANIIPVSMPHTKYCNACYAVLNQSEVASNMAKYDGVEFGHRSQNMNSLDEMFADARSFGFNDVVKQRILAGNFFLLGENYEKYFTKALKIRRLIANDFSTAWDKGCNVLLTPTTLTDAPKYAEFNEEKETDNCTKQDYCTLPANLSGCPAISVPVELSRKGLPLSVQLMAPFNEDKFLLDVAQYIEKVVQFDELCI